MAKASRGVALMARLKSDPSPSVRSLILRLGDLVFQISNRLRFEGSPTLVDLPSLPE